MLPWLSDVAAVLEAWYPGQHGGEAIANLLFGIHNPSGKLPITFPAGVSDLPHRVIAGTPNANNPFPVDYGTAGDCGWGLANCLKIRLAVTPQVFSTLREHPKSYSKTEYEVDQMSKKMLDRISQTCRETIAQGGDFSRVAKDLRFERMIELLYDQLTCQQRLEEYRRRSVWIFQPGAWKARNTRGAKIAELEVPGASGFVVTGTKTIQVEVKE